MVASAAEAGWTLAITAETASSGLDGARVEASSGSGTVQVPLGGVPVWRMARAVSAMYVHAPSDRLVVLTDQDHDASGIIVVDLREARVVTSLKARHITPSPGGRYLAFEEYYSRLDTDWPWNETVYAVLDVTAPGEALRRLCPFGDGRCQGRVIYLPSRQDVCASYRERTGAATCLVPGREPQHGRRSPFVWVNAQSLAFVTVDRLRERADVVLARLDPAVVLAAAPESPGLEVSTHACATPDDRPGRATGCPSVRLPWAVDVIRQDDADGRLWIHFRHRIPEVPGGWLPVP